MKRNRWVATDARAPQMTACTSMKPRPCDHWHCVVLPLKDYSGTEWKRPLDWSFSCVIMKIKQVLNCALPAWYPDFKNVTIKRYSSGCKWFKAHLNYIRDLSPSIRVRARTQSKQVNWCFVFKLIRVCVQDFCLRCTSRVRAHRYMQRFPRTQTSEFVQGCAMCMLKAAGSRGR